MQAPPIRLVGRLLRDVERHAVRARNGVRYLGGRQWGRVGATPKDTVWSQGKASLWRYRSRRVEHTPPVLIFLGLVSRSFILDLHAGNSFVEKLRDAGFDVFLLDWGVPDAADAENSLETYVERYLPRAVDSVLRESGASDLSLVGYCMGGNLALLSVAGLLEAPVRNLITIATPVDFDRLGSLAGPLRDGTLEPDALLDPTGNVPPSYVRRYFQVRKPTSDLVQRANLWDRLWDEEFLEGHQAMGRWVRDQVPFPGAAFRQVVDEWLRRNAFVNGGLRLGGRPVDLDQIDCPVLAVVAMRDEIVPPAAAAPIASLITTSDFELLELDAGHVGLAASRTAAKVTIPAIVAWLRNHSEQR